MVNLTLKESYGLFPDYFFHLLFTVPLHPHYDATRMIDATLTCAVPSFSHSLLILIFYSQIILLSLALHVQFQSIFKDHLLHGPLNYK